MIDPSFPNETYVDDAKHCKAIFPTKNAVMPSLPQKLKEVAFAPKKRGNGENFHGISREILMQPIAIQNTARYNKGNSGELW